MGERLAAALARVEDARGGIHGAAFAIYPRGLALTCAHVVNLALGRPKDAPERPGPDDLVTLRFLEAGEEVLARVVAWSEAQDVAILEVERGLPAGAHPVPLFHLRHGAGEKARAYGFPEGYPSGRWADDLVLGTPLPGRPGLWQVQSGDLALGDSGGPVQERSMGRVVGLVSQVDVREARAFFIPAEAVQEVADQAEVGLEVLRPRYPFSPLTDGLEVLPGNPLGNVEAFLQDYLGTPQEPAPFGGREEALAALERWLAAEGKPFALLVEPAGRGKSALLARWAARLASSGQADVAFVPVSQRFGTALYSAFLALLGARLRHLCRDPSAPAPPLPSSADLWAPEIDQVLRQDRPAEKPLVVVLDGADEAVGWDLGADWRAPAQVGRGVRVLVAARPTHACPDRSAWLGRLRWPQGQTCLLSLEPLTEEGVAQVLQAMGDPLAGLADQERLVRRLHVLSDGGDPLLVRLYVEALRGEGERAAFLKPEDLDGLKPGLGPYFKAWFAAQDRVWRAQGREPLREREDVVRFFHTLACAFGPLSREDVAEVAGPPLDQGARLEQVAADVGRWVLGDGRERGYTFQHPRLAQYFYDELLEQEKRSWERRFVEHGRQVLSALNEGRLDPRRASPYVVQHLGAHLDRAAAWGLAGAQDFYGLVSEGWLRAWEALEGTSSGFLHDVARAWRRAEADRGAGPAGDVGVQVRCALCQASVHALGGNVPAGLLAQVLEHGLLSPAQALALARAKVKEGARARALAALAPHLAEGERETVLAEALAAARSIWWEPGRAEALAALAPHLAALPRESLARLWLEEREGANLLHALARRPRPDLLADLRALAPVLGALGGEAAAAAAFRAIQEVGRWWP